MNEGFYICYMNDMIKDLAFRFTFSFLMTFMLDLSSFSIVFVMKVSSNQILKTEYLCGVLGVLKVITI